MRDVEILAPAGNIDNFYAAVNSGCNAVYLGGKDFNARKRAGNFTNEELKEAIEYAHLRDVQVFLTVNTLYNNDEIENIFKFLDEVYMMGIDAFIVQDIGFYSLAKERYKEVEFHASTQMTAHSLEDVLYLEELGFDRVVLSRELTLNQIKEITTKTNVDIECFVHGALCMSYSGICYMSSFIGDRSGNRGDCAQPCRMKYSIKQGDKLIHKDKYLLSLKDLNTLEIIDDLIEAGIKSLKIEGRLKSKEYTAGVVSIYRKNVDKIDADINKDMDTLKQLFSRGDQTKGYYLDRKDMINREIGKHVGLVIGKSIGKDKVELIKEIKKGDKVAYFKNGKTEGFESDRDYPVGINKFSNVNLTDVINIYKTKDKALTKTLTNLKDNYKMDININFYADKDNVSITLYNDKYSISESIKNNTFDKALDKERLEQQLRKFGSTSFRVVNMDIEGEAVLVSIKEINELRRLAAEKLKEEVLKINRSISNTHIEKYTEGKVNKTTSVLVKDIDQYNIVKKFKDIDKIYVEGFIPEDKEVYYVLPMIDKVSSEKAILEVKDKVKGFVVRTYGQFKICRDNNIDNIVLDYTFNIYNNESARFYKDYIVTESVENKGIIGENVETIVYGKIKVMTMNQCISGTCDKSSNKYTLVDRMNEEYILEADCKNCINYIYSRNNINSKKEKGYIRYNFSFETPKEIRDILISHGYVL